MEKYLAIETLCVFEKTQLDNYIIAEWNDVIKKILNDTIIIYENLVSIDV